MITVPTRKAFSVLIAYFDESGTHADTEATLFSGFIGSAEAFARTEKAWQAILDAEDVPHFHYSRMRSRGRPFEDVDADKLQRLTAKLSDLLTEATPALRVVSASYIGRWDPLLSSEPHWLGRFPTPYSFCFELAMERLHECAREMNEHVVPVLAHHQEYGPSALAMFDTFKRTGTWPLVGPLGFEDPRGRPALQMADFVAYELFQFLRGLPNDTSKRWPLLSRLWANEETSARGVLFNISHNEESLLGLIERGPIPWGKPLYAAREDVDKLRSITMDFKSQGAAYESVRRFRALGKT